MNDNPDHDPSAKSPGLGAGRRRAASAAWRPWAAAALLFLAIVTSARADAPVIGLRFGSHADHGRIVFDCPIPMAYRIEQDGPRIVLQFGEQATVRLGTTGRSGVRNLVSIREEGGTIVLETAGGARLRHFRLGNRVVLDLLDGSATSAPAEAAVRPVAPPPVAARVTPPADAPRAIRAPEDRSPAFVIGAIGGRGADEASAPGAAQDVPSPVPRHVPRAPAEAPVAAARPASAETVAPSPAGRPAPSGGPSDPLQAPVASDPRPPRGHPPARAEAAVAPDAPALAPMASLELIGAQRVQIERDLRHLGYGSADGRPMQERAFRDAVRAYQRQIGAEATGALTFEQVERLRRARSVLAEPRVTAGQMMLVAGDTQVIAAGTWSMVAGHPEHPVNRSYIACSRQAGTCLESLARLTLPEAAGDGTLSSELVTYRVVAWTPREVVAEQSQRCLTRVLTMRLPSQDVLLTDRPHPTAACRAETDVSAGIQVLRHGAEPLARFYEERRAGAAADANPDLRAAADEPGPSAALAARR